MKRFSFSVVATLILGASQVILCGGCGKANRSYNYLFTAHSNGGVVAIANDKGEILWQTKANHPQRAVVSPDGTKVFISESYGAKMVDKVSGKVLWTYKTPKVAWAGVENKKLKKGDMVQLENPVAQILGEDKFLVGNEGKSKLIEINSKGETLKEIVSESLKVAKHGEFRLASKTKQGTYLFPLLESSLLTEYDADGKQIFRVKTRGGVVGAQRLENGDILAGGFFGVAIFGRDGKVKWNFTEKELQKESNAKGGIIICDVKMMPNGNILCTTYAGKDMPDIMEITKDKKVVKVIDFPEITHFSAVELLDDSFKPLK